MAKFGRGYYTLDNFRFWYDPEKPEWGGKKLLPRKKVVKTPAGVSIQTWAPSYSDKDVQFKWKTMDEDFFDELKSRVEDLSTDSDTTHELILHNESPEETWDVHITSLDGKLAEGFGFYSNVKLKFTLVRQAS